MIRLTFTAREITVLRARLQLLIDSAEYREVIEHDNQARFAIKDAVSIIGILERAEKRTLAAMLG